MKSSLVDVCICAIRWTMDILDIAPAILVDGSDATSAVEDITPLGNAMPMTANSESAGQLNTNRRRDLQFSIGIWRQAQLSGSEILG